MKNRFWLAAAILSAALIAPLALQADDAPVWPELGNVGDDELVW